MSEMCVLSHRASLTACMALCMDLVFCQRLCAITAVTVHFTVLSVHRIDEVNDTDVDDN